MKKKQIEWIGGIVPFPIHQPDLPDPKLILWLNEKGLPIGKELHKSDEALFGLCTSLQNTMKSPMIGSPQRPTRIRVDSKPMADMLRAGFPDLDILCAATPEIEDLLQALREQSHENSGPSLASHGVKLPDLEWALVATAGSQLDLTLSYPNFQDPEDDKLLNRLAALKGDFETNYDERRSLELRLFELFENSPEGQAIDPVWKSGLILDIAARYFGHTITTLPASDLRKIIVDVIPDKVAMLPSEATGLVEEFRAFYSFLGRRFGFERAEACSMVLTQEAGKILEGALYESEKCLLLERNKDDVSNQADTAWLFTCAAELYRKKLWEVLEFEESVFTISIPTLGLRELMVAVGRTAENGLLVFSSRQDYFEFLRAGHKHEEALLPVHLLLDFETKDELSPNFLAQIKENDFEVASESAYPLAAHVSPDNVFHEPTRDEVHTLAACARVLGCIQPQHHKAIQQALREGTTFLQTLVVPTPSGEVDAFLSYSDFVSMYEDDMWRILVELGSQRKFQYDEHIALVVQLVELFETSPEADGREMRYSLDLMGCAADRLGHTVATLPAPDLRQIIFEIIPAQFPLAVSEAADVIAELRAFYAFLFRRFGFERAETCLNVLGPNSIKALEKSLSRNSRPKGRVLKNRKKSKKKR